MYQESIRKVALYASVEVQPLAAYFGGVVAQEVVKVTGKYTPLDQWLHLDFLEVGADDCVWFVARSIKRSSYTRSNLRLSCKVFCARSYCTDTRRCAVAALSGGAGVSASVVLETNQGRSVASRLLFKVPTQCSRYKMLSAAMRLCFMPIIVVLLPVASFIRIS